MQLLIVIVLFLMQFFAGFGILNLLGVYLKPVLHVSLSALLGIALFSIVPFLLQLLYIPLTFLNIFISLFIFCLFLNIRSRTKLAFFFNDVKRYHFRIDFYELPFLLLTSLIVFVSVWRCYYFPPTPRDLTSGAEVIAEYAMKEKTMINSVFTVDLSTTNNQFKPPFITSLQIIYKYAGFPFAQIWLSAIFIFFLVFLYHLLCDKLHKIVAGLLLVMFIAIPEMYAYTFMALFDYSNAVFFCLSLYFLFEFFLSKKNNYLILSGLLMSIATYIRSETLILASFTSIAVVIHFLHKKGFLINIVRAAAVFLLPSAIIYFISITVYIKQYLPSSYNVGTLMNSNLLNPAFFYHRLRDMTQHLLLGGNAVLYYGYFIFLFIAVLLLSIFYIKQWSKNSMYWLFAVLVVYFGLPFIAHLFPLYDLENSTKRGLFKIFPLMLLFMGNSAALISISNSIKKWEANS